MLTQVENNRKQELKRTWVPWPTACFYKCDTESQNIGDLTRATWLCRVGNPGLQTPMHSWYKFGFKELKFFRMD